jgi:hypothetical protein
LPTCSIGKGLLDDSGEVDLGLDHLQLQKLGEVANTSIPMMEKISPIKICFLKT